MENDRNSNLNIYIIILIICIVFVGVTLWLTGTSANPYNYSLVALKDKVSQGIGTVIHTGNEDTGSDVATQFHRPTNSTVTPETHRKYLIYNSLIGRLGNQMYAYAALLSLAKKSGRQPRLSTKPQMYQYFPNLTVPVVNSKRLRNVLCGGNDYRQVKAQGQTGFSAGYFINVIEDIMSHGETTCLQIGYGYLFSYKYFNFMKSDILQQFTFTSKIKQEAEKLICSAVQSLFSDKRCPTSSHQTTTIVGIHNRRGDFLKSKTTRILNTAYFVMAIEKLCDLLEQNSSSLFTGRNQTAFLLFGDDMYFNKQLSKKIELKLPWLKIKPVRGSNAGVDLQSLALCNHVITSTGTFSWWAGYLSQGLKLYPQPSIAPGAKSYQQHDRYEESWIKIYS